MNAVKKTLIVFVILAVLIVIAGFTLAPIVLKPIAVKNIAQATHRNVSIERLKINPLTLSITIQGFYLADPDGKTTFVSFDELYVNWSIISSAFHRALILEEIRLEKPYVNITQNTDGTYNFSDLIPREEEKKEAPSKPFHFSLNNIQITGGKVDFHDLPHKTDHAIRELELSVPFVSNIGYDIKKYVEPKFSAVINGDPFRAVGKTMPFESSHATVFDIDLSDVDIPHYLQYVPTRLNFKVASAVLDTHLKVTFMTYQDRSPNLSITGQAALKKVVINDLQGKKLLRVPSLKVDIASVEPMIPKVHLANIVVESPEIALTRDKSGSINLTQLVEPDKKEGRPEPKNAAAPKPDDNKKTELSLLIDHFLIDKADILFTDATPEKPVRIQIAPLRFQASNLSLNKDEKATVNLALTINKKATVAANGAVGINPLTADLALDVKQLTIGPFQSYIPESVRMDVTSGAISTDGKLLLKMDPNEKPVVTYAGKLAVVQLATIDRTYSTDFLKFKRLFFDALSVGYNPLFVNIREISLSDFFARIAINEGGTTNIQDIFGLPKDEAKKTQATAEAPPPKQEKEEKKTEPPPDIKIGKVRFSGGTVDFSDRNIKPNYRARILNLQGGVTGLSSKEISRAGVALKGNLGYGSPVEINGTINPLIKDLFADIKVSFKDIDMSPVSPYTIKFLGYPIIKGKLNFDVSYLIDKRKLTAENKVLFDQLTFGEKMESPDAIAAPVTLAASLLTDRNGKINLDIPVSGSLDDPQFKVWPVIWQILVNLIGKAVTSPFALVSSITGGGEEMSYIEFDDGSARLSETALKKIDALSKVLYDRPQLKMDIEGYVDEPGDKAAVKKRRFERLLKNQKIKAMVAKGESDVSADTVAVAPSEYEKYLTLAYKAADFPRPRTALGFLQDLPPADMEKLLMNHLAVTEQDLEQLAARRAQTVRDQFIQTGKVDPARIFLVKAPALSPEKKDKVKNSRVIFKLK